MQVIIPDPNDQKSVDRPKSLELDKSDQSGRIRTSSENSTPLQQLDIMSLFNVRERKSAIVAMVTSSLTTGSRQPVSGDDVVNNLKSDCLDQRCPTYGPCIVKLLSKVSLKVLDGWIVKSKKK